MPADITGTNVFDLQRNAFTLVKGPIFTTFLLADEINRAPAKTQSALLQAMQERAVTIDRDTHALSPNFTVFATQNPVESEGTYPLPEAQRDRFLFKITMPYPAREDERMLAERTLTATDSPESVLAQRRGAGGGFRRGAGPAAGRPHGDHGAGGDPGLRVDLVRGTREHESVLFGAGPRATQSLLLASRAAAALDGRDFVTPDDIRALGDAGVGASAGAAPGVRDRRPDPAGGHRADRGKNSRPPVTPSRGSARPRNPLPFRLLHSAFCILPFPMLVPRPRLLALVAGTILPLAFAGSFAPETLPLVIGGCLLLALVPLLDAIAAARRPLGLSAEFPPVTRLSKDRPGSIPFLLRNLRPGQPARRLLLGLAFPDPFTSHHDDQPFAVLLPAGADRVRFEWTCASRQRGRFTLDRLYTEESSRLGLWGIRRSLPIAAELRVYPNLFAERRAAPTLFLRRNGLGSHARRVVGRGREFEKLRDYIAGDSIQDISWKATARRQRPVSKVFQVERTQEVYLLLDRSRLSGRASGPEPDAPTALERSITSALLLCLAAERQGDHFGLVSFADRIGHFLRAGTGAAHFDRCRDALYALEPSPVSPDFEELCAFLRVRLRRRALLIFLTSLDDPVLAEGFTRGVELLSRQHLVLVGMPRPPGVRPLFSDPDAVNDADDVYRELSGHLQWDKLRQRQNILRRLGVQFSLLDSTEMTRQLISQYADVKQRQAL